MRWKTVFCYLARHALRTGRRRRSRHAQAGAGHQAAPSRRRAARLAHLLRAQEPGTAAGDRRPRLRRHARHALAASGDRAGPRGRARLEDRGPARAARRRVSPVAAAARAALRPPDPLVRASARGLARARSRAARRGRARPSQQAALVEARRRIGIQPRDDERALVLVPGAEAERSVEATLAGHGLAVKGYLLFHPGSRWQFKCWPADKAAALLDELDRRGERVVISAAPDARERELVADTLARTHHARPIDLSGTLGLKELAALAARARLFIGVDSAPMHIAAAMQTPVVALFGPSGEFEWGPWRVPHRIVASGEHPCRPCGNDGCGGGKVSECPTRLPVEAAMAAVDSLLAR